MTDNDDARHLRLPVEVLKEFVRLPAIEALKKKEITTLDDLCAYTEAELLSQVPGIVPVDIRGFKEGLAQYGLALSAGR